MKDASIYTQKSLWLTESKEKGNTKRAWQFNEDLFLCREKGWAKAQWWDAGITAVYIITLLGINSDTPPPAPQVLPTLVPMHSMNIINTGERKGRKSTGTKKILLSKQILNDKEETQEKTVEYNSLSLCTVFMYRLNRQKGSYVYEEPILSPGLISWLLLNHFFYHGFNSCCIHHALQARLSRGREKSWDNSTVLAIEWPYTLLWVISVIIHATSLLALFSNQD